MTKLESNYSKFIYLHYFCGMLSKKNAILFVVSSSIFFEALDIAIVNLAIPTIKNDFALSHETIQWIQTIYVLFYGGFLIIGGKLSDAFNRKNVFITGTTLFMISSLFAGLSDSMLPLLISRAVQGLGAALMMPSALSILTNVFTESHERGRSIAIFGSFAAIGSGSGLAVGGMIAAYFGWQWIFFMNVPVMLLCIVVALMIIPATQEKKASRPDFLSAVLLTVGILLLTLLIHDLTSLLQNLILLAALIVSVVVIAYLFFARNATERGQLIDFTIFRESEIGVAGYGAFVLFGAFFSGFLFLVPIIMQGQMNFTSAETGFMLVPFSVMSAFTSKYFVPAMLRRMSPITGAIIGLGFMVAGGIFLCTSILLDYNLVLILFSIACVTGLGIAICFTTLTISVIKGIPEHHHGLASSMLNTSFFFGSGLGLAVLGLVMQISYAQSTIYWVVTLTSYAVSGLLLMALGTRRTTVSVPN